MQNPLMTKKIATPYFPKLAKVKKNSAADSGKLLQKPF
jgi:hypothetical protein